MFTRRTFWSMILWRNSGIIFTWSGIIVFKFRFAMAPSNHARQSRLCIGHPSVASLTLCFSSFAPVGSDFVVRTPKQLALRSYSTVSTHLLFSSWCRCHNHVVFANCPGLFRNHYRDLHRLYVPLAATRGARVQIAWNSKIFEYFSKNGKCHHCCFVIMCSTFQFLFPSTLRCSRLFLHLSPWGAMQLSRLLPVDPWRGHNLLAYKTPEHDGRIHG